MVPEGSNLTDTGPAEGLSRSGTAPRPARGA